MKNFISRGAVLTLTAPRDLSSGEMFVVGDLPGVAQTDAVSGSSVEALTVGEVRLPKTNVEIVQGKKVYWNDTNREVTLTASGAVPIGFATRTAEAGASQVYVRLAIKP